ncbi:hypothetical protein FBQ97_20745, partial [Acidobacteria bacterium ACD]|nr:hypothetical protein [Acidobacteria bacterium ACD]
MGSPCLVRNRLALALLVTGLAGAAEARIVSYAPVTERVAAPAHQRRTNRRFVLVEAKSSFWFLGNPSYGYPAQTPTGRLVVYDTEGREPPREVFPQGGDEASFGDVAAHEGRDGQLRILAVSNGAVGAGENIDKSWRILLSTDTGRSFLKVTLPAGYERLQRSFGDRYSDDFGGPFCRGRDSSVRTGTDETPFVLVLQRSGSTLERGLVAIDANGTARLLARLNDTTSGNYGSDLAGQDASGSRFLVSGSVEHPSGALSTIPPNGVYAVGIDGSITRLIETVSHIPYVEGWITPDGAAYVEVDWQWVQPRTPFRARRALYVVRDGQPSLVAVSPVDSPSDVAVRRGLFSIPTADFSGAWVVTRAYGKPTILARHDPRTGLVEAWRDEAGPEVDALYAGASGRRLIVQVHRRRQLEGLQFWDPALATWEVGQPAPRAYDELFVVDQDNNGFVHVDVDGFAEGAPFWFDSGLPQMTGGVPAGRLAGVGAYGWEGWLRMADRSPGPERIGRARRRLRPVRGRPGREQRRRRAAPSTGAGRAARRSRCSPHALRRAERTRCALPDARAG